MEKTKSPGAVGSYLKRNAGTIIGLLILTAIVSFSTPKFFTSSNLLNLLRSNSVNAIISCGMLLAITGAIRDEILPIEEVCMTAMREILSLHPEYIQKRYQIDIHEDPYVVFQRIAEKRKYCRSGNEMDEKRTFETFLKELRDDKLGRMTWEIPDADSK